MHKRIGIVILVTLLLLLSACQQTESISDAELEAIIGDTDRIDPNRLVFFLDPQSQWISPNPRNHWGVVGRDLQVNDQMAIRITFRLEPKDYEGQDFEEALDSLAAYVYELNTTEYGAQYARGTSPVSDYIIYRDYEDEIMIITLMNILGDTLDTPYIADWERIALEGDMLELD